MRSATASASSDIFCVFDEKSLACDRCGFVAPVSDAIRNCPGINRLPHVEQMPPPAPTHGPGTELKKLLSRVGITASPDCSCNARARLMDERGIEWCEANIDEIVGWLREEASKRGLPFVDMAGRMLVKRAIRNARKHPTPSGPLDG